MTEIASEHSAGMTATDRIDLSHGLFTLGGPVRNQWVDKF